MNVCMKTIRQSVLLLTVLTSSVPLTVPAFDLARNGAACAVIVTGKEPAPHVQRASQELANYLERITGAKFRIRAERIGEERAILVGTPYPEAARHDELCVRVKDSRTLEVTGEGTRGPWYAVYDLLETFGVRFWQPDYETVPQKKTLVLPDDYRKTDAPWMEIRDCSGQRGRETVIWSVKLRLTSGIKSAYFGGSRQFDNSQSLCETLIKFTKYRKKHPEYFAWNPKEHRHAGYNVCFTNKKLPDVLCREIRERMEKNPDTEYISISPPDGLGLCMCEECRLCRIRHGISGQILTLVNPVAETLEKEFPDVKFMVLSYALAGDVPIDIVPAKNVRICYATYARDYAMKVSNPDGAPWKAITGWRKVCGDDRPMYIWDYYACFGNYLIPCADLDLMADAFAFYKRNGIRGVSAQLPFGSMSEFTELKPWLFSKLAWNPDADFRRLIKEYMEACCGKAAPFVLQYIARLEKCRDTRRGPLIHEAETRHWIKPEEIVEFHKLFQKAFDAVKDAPDDKKRLERLFAPALTLSLLRWKEFEPAAQKAGLSVEYGTLLEQLREYGIRHKHTECAETLDFRTLIRNLSAAEPIRQPKSLPNVNSDDLLNIME